MADLAALTGTAISVLTAVVLSLTERGDGVCRTDGPKGEESRDDLGPFSIAGLEKCGLNGPSRHTRSSYK